MKVQGTRSISVQYTRERTRSTEFQSKGEITESVTSSPGTELGSIRGNERIGAVRTPGDRPEKPETSINRTRSTACRMGFLGVEGDGAVVEKVGEEDGTDMEETEKVAGMKETLVEMSGGRFDPCISF